MFGRTKDQPELPLAVAGPAPTPEQTLGDVDKLRLAEGLCGGGYGAIALLNSFRAVQSPLYAPACGFVLAALEKQFRVPSGYGGTFYGRFEAGAFAIILDSWRAGGRSFLQEIGSSIRHGVDPLPAA